MKTLFLLVLALISANGFAQEYSGPSFSSMHNLCQAEGHTMKTFGKCLRIKLDKYYPSWNTLDDDSKPVMWYLDYLDTIGERVKRKEITESRANELAKQELLNLVSEKQRKQQTLAAEKDQQQAAEEKRRNEAFQRDHQERLAQEQAARERALYDYQQAQLKIQEEQLRQQRNKQMIETGIQLMQLGQRRYAPPPPIPVTCTSDRWNGMVTTSCQ